MGNAVVKAAAIDFGLQWVCFMVAAALKTEKFYDLTGSATFALLAYRSLVWGGTYHTRQKLHTACVCIWALRLGSYLFTRIMRSGGVDRRFDGVRDNPKLFFIYWTLQGVWVLFTLLPTVLLNSEQRRNPPITAQDYIGYGLWLAGFLLEVTADYQKAAFRSDPQNKGRFISSGVWSLCRHPNYLGEITLWSGLALSALTSLSHSPLHTGLTLASPALLTLLLTRVSGVPLLEKYGVRKWGSEPDYQQYILNTPVLIPRLSKLFGW